ncbi:dihydrodipicolinate synthase family protein [Flindersiella endophytica]
MQSVGRPETGTETAGSTGAGNRLERLRGGVVAAALTPFRSDGSVGRAATNRYITAIRDGGVRGLAVGAHTGRGARLPASELAWLVEEYSSVSGLPVVAGLGVAAGGSADSSDDTLLRLGERLIAAGATALLVNPPPGASRERIVGLHEKLGGELGIPLVAFVLYERASGCQYDSATVAELAALPFVDGVKLALLDDAMACQDLIAVVRRQAPETLVLTGEDRMYGPSLMWGADAALVGIAAALPALSVAVLDAWNREDYAEFVAASARLDALAALTFREPMEGYVQRMAWAAEWQGILPGDLANDPYGPPCDPAEREALRAALAGL